MTSQSLAEQAQSDIRSIQSDLRDLQSAVRMSDIRDHVEDLQSSINGMDRRIKSLRDRGYAFDRDLEEKANDFAEEWKNLAPGINREIDREARTLKNSLRSLEPTVTGLAGRSGGSSTLRAQIDKTEHQISTLQSRVEAIEQSIRGSYDGFSSQVQAVNHLLGKIEWMIEELSEASFDLLATESGIMAVKAVWAEDGKERKDDPEGVLFLTDQRLIFEQKEKIATKKVLFITTKKELVQKMLWEAPVALIEKTKASKEGFMNKDDFIEVQFGGDAPFDTVYLHIWQSGETWKSLLKRAKSKEFDSNRALEIDEETAQKVKDAPTECNSCGGAITQVIMRGMDSITCEYCGAVIRL